MTAPDHDLAGPALRGERDRIRALLLADRPDLSRHLQTGPSGALLIALPGGDGIEIGRLRRRGRARWVVVARDGDSTLIREPATLSAVARTALVTLAGGDRGPASWDIGPGVSC